jgi:hypothetical protein
MSVGLRTRRSRRAPSDLTIPVSALRALREAHVLGDAEFRQRAGRVEFRIPGADWRPIEEAADPRPVQLAAPLRGEEYR